MAVIELEGNMNVLEAARIRIINAFDTGLDIRIRYKIFYIRR